MLENVFVNLKENETNAGEIEVTTTTTTKIAGDRMERDKSLFDFVAISVETYCQLLLLLFHTQNILCVQKPFKF